MLTMMVFLPSKVFVFFVYSLEILCIRNKLDIFMLKSLNLLILLFEVKLYSLQFALQNETFKNGFHLTLFFLDYYSITVIDKNILLYNKA